MRSREHVLVSTLFAEAWKAGTRSGPRRADRAGPGAADHQGRRARSRIVLSRRRIASRWPCSSTSCWRRPASPRGSRASRSTSIACSTAEGKPRVSVITIAHLDDQERMFFVSLLLNELVAWMRAQRGTSSLRAMVYFDEIFGFLPPVANPPSKAPLLKLLKQARAFGLGLVVATQNPGGSGLQGAGQRRHLDARPPADRSRQGARARRPRRRGGNRRRRASIARRSINCCRPRQARLPPAQRAREGADPLRDALDAFVSARATGPRGNQAPRASAAPAPAPLAGPARRDCRTRGCLAAAAAPVRTSRKAAPLLDPADPAVFRPPRLWRRWCR